jgi:hypothetical protein
MAKYRIRIEALDPAEELRAEYRMGIECDGFTILTMEDQDDRKGIKVSIHKMSNYDVATALCRCPATASAVFLAKAEIEADNYRLDHAARRLMERLTGNIERDGDD